MTMKPLEPICLLALVFFAGCRTPHAATAPPEAAPVATPVDEPALEPALEPVKHPAELRSATRTAWSRRAPRRTERLAAYRRQPARLRGNDLAPANMLDRQIAGLHLDSVTSLRKAGATLASLAHVNLMVDSAAENAFADAGGELNLTLDHPLRLRSALNLMTRFAGDDIAWTVRDGVVLITTKERARGRPKLAMFDVQDLLWSPPHFAAPEMGVLASGMRHEPPEPPESAPLVNDGVLIDMIKGSVAPGTWDENGNSIEIVNGKLIVTHD